MDDFIIQKIIIFIQISGISSLNPFYTAGLPYPDDGEIALLTLNLQKCWVER